MAEEEQPMDTPDSPTEPQPEENTAPLTPETAAEPAAEETAAPAEIAPADAPAAEAAADPAPEGGVANAAASDAAEGEEAAAPALELPTGGLTLKDVAEALVFASPKPITTKEIVAALKAAAAGSEDPLVQAIGKAKPSHVVEALREVATELEATGRAFRLVEKISGWVLVSDPQCAQWVRQLYPEAKPTRLSGPQLETLAIIAYRQPVTRADIEAVRGVAVDGVMQVLLDRSLVKIAGRADVPGRPLLYSTTDYFLEHFGLKTTDDLPNASELKRVQLPTAPAPEVPAADAAPAKSSRKRGAPAATATSAAGEAPAGTSTTSSESGESLVEPSTSSSEPEESPGELSMSSSEPEESPVEPSTTAADDSDAPEAPSTDAKSD